MDNMNTANGTYAIGTAVYYTGDMANASGTGEVVRIRQASQWGAATMDLRMEDGREMLAIPMGCFSKGPGRRFFAMAEWQAKREAEIAQMKAEYEAFLARKEGGR